MNKLLQQREDELLLDLKLLGEEYTVNKFEGGIDKTQIRIAYEKSNTKPLEPFSIAIYIPWWKATYTPNKIDIKKYNLLKYIGNKHGFSAHWNIEGWTFWIEVYFKR